MVVHDLDVPSISVTPYETNSPLIVDANAVLSLPVTTKPFQTVARRHTQIGKLFGCIDDKKLLASAALNLRRETTYGEACEDRSRTSVAKAPDHGKA